VNPDEFGRLFTTFRRTAFRLETLAAYNVPEEAESLRLWREGKPPPAWQKEREWLRMVANATAAGKSMQRVRVVRRPLSDYVRLEFDWGYPDNIAIGEDIRILELTDGDNVPGMLDHDYWLFDDVIVVRMEYTSDGSFIRPVEVSDVAPYCRCRDVAMARAVPFSQYRVHTT
jgi:hypothetical protein